MSEVVGLGYGPKTRWRIYDGGLAPVHRVDQITSSWLNEMLIKAPMLWSKRFSKPRIQLLFPPDRLVTGLPRPTIAVQANAQLRQWRLADVDRNIETATSWSVFPSESDWSMTLPSGQQVLGIIQLWCASL